MNFVYTFLKINKYKKKSLLIRCNHLKVYHTDLKFLLKKNIIFINDSKATSFTAASLAISSLKTFSGL